MKYFLNKNNYFINNYLINNDRLFLTFLFTVLLFSYEIAFYRRNLNEFSITAIIEAEHDIFV